MHGPQSQKETLSPAIHGAPSVRPKLAFSPSTELPTTNSNQSKIDFRSKCRKTQRNSKRKSLTTKITFNLPLNYQIASPQKVKPGSPNLQSTTTTTQKSLSSKKHKRCSLCSTTYKTPKCLKEHQTFFHPKKGDIPKVDAVPNH